MNNEKHNQIIDEVWSNYRTAFVESYVHHELDECLSLEEFIEEIKTDSDFSEKWGIQIEERVLSTQERNEWYQIHRNGNNPLMKSDWKFFELDQQNIPTKLITLKYKKEKIESYE